MTKFELLAPAGNLDKLKTAFYFGADAVYIGGKNFSLRSFADNFTYDELRAGVEIAHNLGRKVYITANIFARNSDFIEAATYFKHLQEINADAVLITDPGLIALAREVAPSLPIHLSTQANTLNKYSVKFWGTQGISRVVVARELPLADIGEMHEFTPNIELEAFVHGAMCVSYSGRCLLSNYFTDRDSNRGECVQACRWNYQITDNSYHKDNPIGVEEDERGTYFMNSKDLNLLKHIPELKSAGITSLKIEGRMKSEYYVATVVSAYRHAIDEFERTGSINNSDKLCEELATISHRRYTTAYLLCDDADTINYTDEQYHGTCDFIGTVLSSTDSNAIIEMRSRFYKDDVLEILSPNEYCYKTIAITKILTSQGIEVEDAKLVQEHYNITIPFALKSGDILRRRKLDK